MLTILVHDVEDINCEESDDAALWCAEILRDEGLTGTFFIVGERARQWEQRGRRDVIEAMKWHDLAFHSTWHSVHPTTTEICLDNTFKQGMDALWDWDAQGWQDAERIFGRPLAGWGCSGSSWAPSVPGLMGRMGRCYVYGVDLLGDQQVAWYANCLNFPGYIGGFDAVYCDDAEFEKTLQWFDQHSEELLRKWQFFCLFMCHPTRVISKEFWDVVNFARGANPPRSEWKRQQLHPAELIPTMQKNYRRLCQHVKQQRAFEVVGLPELVKRFDYQEPFIPHEYLMSVCADTCSKEQVIFTDEFTAAELLTAMCEAATAPGEHYPRRSVFGPDSMPPESSATEFDAGSIRAAAGGVLSFITTNHRLPESAEVNGAQVGIGAYFVALARALSGKASVTAPGDVYYPAAAQRLSLEIRGDLPGWPIHPHDMNLDNLCEQASLQCWTLKPAFARDLDRGKDFAERYGLQRGGH